MVAVAATLLVTACAPSGQGERATGDPCQWSVECAGGLCLAERPGGEPSGWTGGMCSAPCGDGACASDSEVCVKLQTGARCLPGCVGDEGCREGYLCVAAAGACLPDCRLGWDCGVGFPCGEDGRCALDGSGLAALGEPCDPSDEGPSCASGICLAAAMGWPSGLCAEPCGTDACVASGRCVPLGGAPLCLPTCSDEPPCREGYLCSAELGTCLPDCRLGWDCGVGWVCGADGRCQTSATGLAASGEACVDPGACATGLCLAEEDGWPGGMCAGLCQEGVCPDGASCAVLGGVPWCLPGCAAGSACREGYVCSDELGACLPDCTLGWECGAGLACGADGRCALAGPLLADLGDPCDAAAACTSGLCFSSEDGWPDGLCADVCGGSCTDDAGGCVPLAGQPWCLPSCATAADCRAGYICSDDLAVCLPDCRLGWDCGTSFDCDDADGQCQPKGPPAGAIGLPCGVPADCGEDGLTCLVPGGGGPAGPGFCTQPCSGGEPCPDGAGCAFVAGSTVCLPSCASGELCPPKWFCAMGSGVCMPPMGPPGG